MISLTSGYSSVTSSGNISLATANAGLAGVSGEVSIKTGDSTFGYSGALSMSTGGATGGRGGSITIAVGEGDSGAGGDVDITAGTTTAIAAGGTLDSRTRSSR